jgi:hypothetical protein
VEGCLPHLSSADAAVAAAAQAAVQSVCGLPMGPAERPELQLRLLSALGSVELAQQPLARSLLARITIEGSGMDLLRMPQDTSGHMQVCNRHTVRDGLRC